MRGARRRPDDVQIVTYAATHSHVVGKRVVEQAYVCSQRGTEPYAAAHGARE